MIPVMIIVMIVFGIMGIVGTVVIIAMLIAQIVLVAATKARTPLHDKLAHTVAVDYASQMMFDSPEAMIAYKQRIHAPSMIYCIGTYSMPNCCRISSVRSLVESVKITKSLICKPP